MSAQGVQRKALACTWGPQVMISWCVDSRILKEALRSCFTGLPRGNVVVDAVSDK